jgi:hypothetical protein
MKYTNDRLFELLGELSGASVKFVVCGGVACVLHGVDRTTLDLDVSVSMDEENLRKVVEVCRKMGLYPRIAEPIENLYDPAKRKEWIENKGALDYTFVSGTGPLQLDIFLTYPKSYEELLKDSQIVMLDELKVFVSSIEDLLAAKERIEPIRDKDRTDIEWLKKLLDGK